VRVEDDDVVHEEEEPLSETDEEEPSSETDEDSSESDDDEHDPTDSTNLKISDNQTVNDIIPNGENVTDSNISKPGTDDFEELFYTGRMLSREQLISYFKSLHTGPKMKEGVATIGLVGYPNVGKSSTINAILTHKKVSVSATPGKTKHFQTLFVDNELLLCDCPGLVFPNFVSTKADMVVNGILPIDEMRDHVPPINLVAMLFPRKYLEQHYSLLLPPPMEGEDPDRVPTAEELLNSYGYMRGYMTQRGLPDQPRTARYILKDYVQGKLLYSYAPPGVSQESYHPFYVEPRVNRDMTPQQKRINRSTNPTSADLDGKFFSKSSQQAHTKGVQGVTGYARRDGFTVQHSVPVSQENMGFHVLGRNGPGRKEKKHKKKEKLRRVYSHLDE
jgi:large subunit GTPase 1